MEETLQSYANDLRRIWQNKRSLLFQSLSVAMVVLSALMIWKSCMVLLNNESPIVVVLSGSMEPAMQRGDILVLNNNAKRPVEVGDIVVYNSYNRDIPIVHRVLNRYELPSGGFDYLTKGDNNNGHDEPLYGNRLWINRTDILGVITSYLPHCGVVTILMNDYPKLKYAVLGTMAILVFTGRDS